MTSFGVLLFEGILCSKITYKLVGGMRDSAKSDAGVQASRFKNSLASLYEVAFFLNIGPASAGDVNHLQVLELVHVCLACDQDRLVIVFPQMFSESNGITLKPAEVKIFSEQNADPHDLVKVVCLLTMFWIS